MLDHKHRIVLRHAGRQHRPGQPDQVRRSTKRLQAVVIAHHPSQGHRRRKVPLGNPGRADGKNLGMDRIQEMLRLENVAQWLRLSKGETPSGIVRGGFRWADGLTWDMIDRDLTRLSKVPSKTADKMPDALVFDLSLVPDVQARLRALPHRVGPVIVDRHGMPYRKESWGDLFRKFRGEAEVPDTIWMMNTRAGAINDAKNKGASPIQMQHQANHASLATTNRYIRERSESANQLIQMRAGK